MLRLPATDRLTVATHSRGRAAGTAPFFLAAALFIIAAAGASALGAVLAAIGADADLAIWDEREFVLHNSQLHHAVDHTPYEGMTLRAWPGCTVSRGEVVWDGKAFHGQAGRGKFLQRGAPTLWPRSQGALA